MKDDFKNFLMMKNSTDKFKNSPGVSESVTDYGKTGRSSISTRLVKNTMTPGKLKPLFDSSYVPPIYNSSVIQDDDPVKQHAINAAIKRYRDDIERKSKTDDNLLAKHFERVRRDEEQKRYESELKRRKQEAFCRDIVNQINLDVSGSLLF